MGDCTATSHSPPSHQRYEYTRLCSAKLTVLRAGGTWRGDLRYIIGSSTILTEVSFFFYASILSFFPTRRFTVPSFVEAEEALRRRPPSFTAEPPEEPRYDVFFCGLDGNAGELDGIPVETELYSIEFEKKHSVAGWSGRLKLMLTF